MNKRSFSHQIETSLSTQKFDSQKDSAEYFLSILKTFIFSGTDDNFEKFFALHQKKLLTLPESLIKEVFVMAAEQGQLDILRYFHEKNGLILEGTFVNQSLEKAVRRDHDNVIRYLHQQGVLFEKAHLELLSSLCFEYEGFACLSYFQNTGLLSLSTKQIANFIFSDRDDNFEKIVDLHQNNLLTLPEPLIKEIFMMAAEQGRLDILRYFHEKNGLILEGAFVRESLEKATIQDQDSVIQYLHQQGAHFEKTHLELLSSLCFEYESCACLSYFQNTGLLSLSTKEKETLFFLETSLPRSRVEFKDLQGQRARDTLSLIHILSDNIQNLDELLIDSSPEDIKIYYFLAITNGHTHNFHMLRKIFPFLGSTKEIEAEAFELALISGRDIIISFFLSTANDVLIQKQNLRRFVKAAAQFCNEEPLHKLIDYYKGLHINIGTRLLYWVAFNGRFELLRTLSARKDLSFQFFSKIDTNNLPPGEVREFLADRRVLNEVGKDMPIINSMKETLLNDQKEFHPSSFWQFFSDIHMAVLKENGFMNFKRSVNQTYFNFIMRPSELWSFCYILLFQLFHNIRRSFSYILVDPDILTQAGNLKPVYRRIFSKNRRVQLFLYKLVVGSLWDYVKNRDPEELLSKLEEPEVGNPIRLSYNKKLISQDLANSVNEYYFIQSYLKKLPQSSLKIVEIGAGYGRLGYVLLNALNCKYIIFDIPPALYISQKYMSEIFPNKKIFSFRPFDNFEDIREELENSDIAFFTINQIKFFPENYSDICINISSLHEMTVQQRMKISEYMEKITSQYIYIKQYKKYINPYDNLIVKEKDYQFSPSWKCVRRRRTPTNLRFFEKLFKKIK